MSTESQTYKECRSFAIARHDLISQLTAGDDATAKAWSLASTSAMLGLEERWYAVAVADDKQSARVCIGDQIGCWDSSNAKALLDSLQGVGSIKLIIDSCGGDSNCALDLFHGFAGRVVEATVTGKCWSAAVTIAMSAEKIRIDAGARFMVHQPRLCKMGTAAELRQSADCLDKLTGQIARIISERTKQPLSTVKAWFDSPTDKYFSSAQAVEFGFADEICNATTAESGFLCFSPGSAVSPSDNRTPEERLCWSALNRLGEFRVKDKNKFLTDLDRWQTFKVREQ